MPRHLNIVHFVKMASCVHQGWFDISGDQTFLLHDTGRITRLALELPFPDKQFPSTLFFIGGESRRTALRQLFPNNNVNRGNANGLIKLNIDTSTLTSDFPILFADGNLSFRIPSKLGGVTCHRTASYPINWSSRNSHELILATHARLVAPFTEVICLFADDFSSLSEVATLLVSWIELTSPTDAPNRIRPRVVIVVSEQPSSATQAVLELENLRFIMNNLDKQSRTDVFSSITVLQLAAAGPPPTSPYSLAIDGLRKSF